MFRLLAILFLLIAIGLAVYDVFNYFGKDETAVFGFSQTGALWFQLHPTSLQEFQPAVERYLSPAIWQDFFQPLVLEQPAALVFLVLAAIFLGLSLLFGLLFRRKKRRERRSNSIIPGRSRQ